MDKPIKSANRGPVPSKRAAPRRANKPFVAETANDFVDLFAAALGDLTDNMAAVAAMSADFAKPDRGEMVVDVAALVSALLNAPQSGKLATAAQWLQQWAAQPVIGFMLREPAVAVGLAPALSNTLRGIVLPRAVALRDLTMGTTPEPVGLRHLLFALAEQPGSKWPPRREGGPVTDALLYSLRAQIVERTGANPLKGESMAAWQALLKAEPPPVVPPRAEATRLLSDNPSSDDMLGRQPLAAMLATRLVDLQAKEADSADPRAVMVHLHGAWGSGKSSMVRILTAALAAQQPGWLVVDFNAWRNARVKPPWWNMLTEFKREVSARLPWWRRFWLDVRWAWVSPSVDNVTIVLGGLLAAALLFWLGAQAADAVDGLKLFGGFASAVVLALGTVRSLMLGGKRTADSFDALRTDSFRPFVTLFDMLVTASPAPVLIVLDDLDRCDAGTVTDLLEGIQTLFRGKPVVFLAVADRHWITTSFAERFKLFEGGDRARPVGDQFLDKMFQLSIAVPRIGRDVQTRYLKELLGIAPATPPETANVDLAPDDIDHDQIMARIASAPKAQRPRLRVQAVQRIATPAAEQRLTHRLEDFVEHMEANPRAIKRLINAIGLNQARVVLELRTVAFDDIVRWTIMELRWPHIAAWIENGWDSPASPARHSAGLKIGLDHMPDRPDFVEAAMTETDFAALTASLGSAALASLLMPPPYDAEEA